MDNKEIKYASTEKIYEETISSAFVKYQHVVDYILEHRMNLLLFAPISGLYPFLTPKCPISYPFFFVDQAYI